jgi:cation transport ATPase
MPLWLRALNPWLQLFFATLVVLIGAKPFLQRGFTNICNRFTPIALAISIAYVYSLHWHSVTGLFSISNS